MLVNRSRYGDTIKPVTKMVISLIVLGIISSILLDLLGFRTISPAFPFTIAAIASAGIGLIMIGIVLFYGKDLAVSADRAFPSYPELFTIVYSMFQILAVWIAYTSFSGAINPLLGGSAWLYPLLFFGIALMPAIRAVTTVINNIDKWVDRVQASPRQR